MRAAIVTKYLKPTGTKGGRVKATCDAQEFTDSYDHALSVEANHEKAAWLLCVRMGWRKIPGAALVGGFTPDGYAFVLVTKEEHAEKSLLPGV